MTMTEKQEGGGRGERGSGREEGGGREGEGGGGGGGGSHFIHSRSRMTIHPHPYNGRTEHVEFSPTRQTLRARSAKRREEFGESHEG